MIALASVMETSSCRSDDALITQVVLCAEGAREAFDLLMARYRPWVLQRCRFHLGSDDDAQDVAQQVFIRAHAHLAQLKDRAQFKAWLRMIANNCCNRFLNQRSRYVTGDDADEVLNAREVISSDNYLYMEKAEAVGEVLSQLPVTAQQVLTLRFFEELSLVQIAENLRLTLSAAKARLYRALAQFRSVFELTFEGDSYA